MARAPKMCFDRILPRNLRQRQSVATDTRTGRLSAISLIGKQWPNGSTITIRFMDGTDAQKQKVREFAKEWTDHANLDFEFTDSPTAVIRVSFDASDGAWSYVGIDNLDIPLHSATLNLGWQDRGVILHEFGHMIGLSHEHQNPDGGIQWDEEQVIADLAGPPNYWSESQTRFNVLKKYDADQIHGTEFDPESIMLYAFPASWTTNDFSTSENEELSDLDKAFVAAANMYPPDEVAVVTELSVASVTSAAIGEPGEVDEYKFKVTQEGDHLIQTSGKTDVFMTLFGPDSQIAKIAEDDDSGSGRNAKISVDLSPGEYFLQVRHYSERRTGDYSIQVSRP